MPTITFIIFFLSSFLLSSCSLAPTYHRPELEIPDDYKEIGKWQLANPHVASLNRGKWWEVYEDPQLNQLADQVTLANQDLKLALANYQQARAIAGVARSALFPLSNAVAIPSRQQTSNNTANVNPNTLYNDYLIGADLSYQIDVFGQDP